MAIVNRLNSTFTSLISDLMVLERQPLSRMQVQKDTLSVRSKAYSDAKTRLSDLQTAVKALISTSTSYAATAGRTAAITNVSTGTTVLTASAGASSVPGVYNFSNIVLAKEHRVRSERQAYSDQALNKTGTLLLGGAASRSASLVAPIAGTVTGAAPNLDAAAVESGQLELGSGAYYVETRQDTSGAWQFRLVDGEGNAVSIKDGSTTTYTAGWQAIPTSGGQYNTGRGLLITFGADSAGYSAGGRGDTLHPAAQVDYTTRGAQVSVTATDSLNTIAANINSATYATGMGVNATVVDNMLILASRSSGAAHQIIASDLTGSVLSDLKILGAGGQEGDLDATDGFTYTLQKGTDASFKVNDITVTRSSNTSLTNVISGVTLNLAADAEGKTATLTVGSSFSAARSAVDTFIEKFNSLQSYLYQKTAVDSTTVSGVTTYARGALADDNIFSELRGDLFYTVMTNVESGGLKSLREIGLGLDDNLQASIIDSAKLETALNSDLNNVKTLLDGVMNAIDNKLSRFTGTTSEQGYMDKAISNFTTEISEVDGDIADMNVRLQEKEESLVNQYAELQSQLYMLSYTQQMWSSIYGTVNQMV